MSSNAENRDSGPATKSFLFAHTLARSVKQHVVDSCQSLLWPQRPQFINIEVTAACDARCIHCPRHRMDRAVHPMDFDLFHSVIDQAAEMGIPEVRPNGFGELLTLRNLDEYLLYMRAAKHHFIIRMNTNGSQLTDDKIRLFIETQVDSIHIAVDGTTKQTYESIRRNLSFERVEGNIRRLVAIRDRASSALPRLIVLMVMVDANRHEIAEFRERWKDIADRVDFYRFSNRTGSLDNSLGTQLQARRFRACAYPFREMSVWADGKVVLCTSDWNEEYVVGDVTKQKLPEIWHGSALRRARELHRLRRGADISICARCNDWAKLPLFAHPWNR